MLFSGDFQDMPSMLPNGGACQDRFSHDVCLARSFDWTRKAVVEYRLPLGYCRCTETLMRSLLFLLFMGVVVFLVAGWFLDWYDINSVKNSNGKTSIQFDINNNKIKEDIGKGTQKFNDTLNNLQDDKNKSQPTTATTNRGPNGT